MSADRNLLFGILAVQMDFVSRDQLIAGMHAWVLEKSRPLGEILHAAGHLDVESLALLEALIKKHLAQHNNDPQQSLAAVSSIKSVRQDLGQLADSDVAASLVHVSQNAAADPFATTLPEAADNSSPASRFRVLRAHARGGLGEIYVAQDTELDREVALKEIQSRFAHNDSMRARFLLEGRVTGRLEHPGIVPVYGLGIYPDGRPYYAMRLIDGQTLQTAIENFHASDNRESGLLDHDVSFRKLLGRFVDVCNAVGYAHSRGVIHRDLKPVNVMLGRHGETLVVDWGLAKVLNDPHDINERFSEVPLEPSTTSATLPGSAIGTPGYASPEQATGQLELLGPGSDIYSLGCILYMLLTGRVTVAGSSFNEEYCRCITTADFPRPREINPAIPAILEATCLRALSPTIADRFPDCHSLIEPVEEFLAGRELAAALYRERTAREQAEQQTRLAEQQTRLAEQREAETQRQLYFSKIYRAAGDLESGRHAQAADTLNAIPFDQRGWEAGYLSRHVEGTPLTLRGHSSTVHSVAFSPDGTQPGLRGCSKQLLAAGIVLKRGAKAGVGEEPVRGQVNRPANGQRVHNRGRLSESLLPCRPRSAGIPDSQHRRMQKP